MAILPRPAPAGPPRPPCAACSSRARLRCHLPRVRPEFPQPPSHDRVMGRNGTLLSGCCGLECRRHAPRAARCRIPLNHLGLQERERQRGRFVLIFLIQNPVGIHADPPLVGGTTTACLVWWMVSSCSKRLEENNSSASNSSLGPGQQPFGIVLVGKNVLSADAWAGFTQAFPLNSPGSPLHDRAT